MPRASPRYSAEAWPAGTTQGGEGELGSFPDRPGPTMVQNPGYLGGRIRATTHPFETHPIALLTPAKLAWGGCSQMSLQGITFVKDSAAPLPQQRPRIRNTNTACPSHRPPLISLYSDSHVRYGGRGGRAGANRLELLKLLYKPVIVPEPHEDLGNSCRIGLSPPLDEFMAFKVLYLSMAFPTTQRA